MFDIQMRSTSRSWDTEPRQRILSFVNLLFLGTAFLAPVELQLVAAFTLYDALIVALAFLMVAILMVARHPPLQFLSLKFTAVIYVFLLFALLSTFRSTEPVESLTRILQYIFIFFVQIPVILTLSKSQSMVRMSLFLMVGGMLVVVMQALLFGHVHRGSGRTLTFYSENANRLGYPTAYLLPVFLYLLFYSWHRRRSLVVIIVSLPVLYPMVWALAASGSRSSTLATLAAATVFLAFRQGPQINPQLIGRLLFAVVVIVSLSYGFYQSDYFPTTLHDRIEGTLTPGDPLSQDRVSLNLAGWRAFLESPLVGVGLENMRYVAKRYVSYVSNQDPHNLWIGLLSQIGLFGTLAFFVLIVTWFVLLLRAQSLTKDRSQRELLGACIASMVAIMVIHMFVPLMIQRQYWLIYGLGLALAFSSREEQVQDVPSAH